MLWEATQRRPIGIDEENGSGWEWVTEDANWKGRHHRFVLEPKSRIGRFGVTAGGRDSAVGA